jgi:hypothetical protein
MSRAFDELADNCHRAINKILINFGEVESLLVLINPTFRQELEGWLESNHRLCMPYWESDFQTTIWGYPARFQLTAPGVLPGEPEMPYLVVPIIKKFVYHKEEQSRVYDRNCPLCGKNISYMNYHVCHTVNPNTAATF